MNKEAGPTGILLVDKSVGVTSADVVAKIKRLFGRKTKIGHAGTLDPFATGLLVCLLGSATRLARFFQSGEKEYSGLIRLGLTTDSDDITGNLLSKMEVLVTDPELQNAIDKFKGSILQTPPRVSAVKINGERAYKKARRGEEFEISKREVTISKFSGRRLNQNTLEFKIRCGGGTYIRSIARDLGEYLGCGATLESLRREESTPFRVEQARSIEEVDSELIMNWSEGFKSYPYIDFPAQQLELLKNGDNSPLLIESERIRKIADSGAKKGFMVYGDQVPRGILSEDNGAWKVELNIHPGQ